MRIQNTLRQNVLDWHDKWPSLRYHVQYSLVCQTHVEFCIRIKNIIRSQKVSVVQCFPINEIRIRKFWSKQNANTRNLDLDSFNFHIILFECRYMKKWFFSQQSTYFLIEKYSALFQQRWERNFFQHAIHFEIRCRKFSKSNWLRRKTRKDSMHWYGNWCYHHTNL